mmetsp:Transcript_26867/g.55296  ORF Transcript_26867/g.55296 Transcript_26867/m.55296 type:complete len:80 (+) Transcript_26867:262-501(+)
MTLANSESKRPPIVLTATTMATTFSSTPPPQLNSLTIKTKLGNWKPTTKIPFKTLASESFARPTHSPWPGDPTKHAVSL